MGLTCDLCGEEAAESVDIEIGDTWKGTIGGPPHTVFTGVRMIHAAPAAVPPGEIKLFIHTNANLKDT